MSTKLKIDLSQGLLEVEGSEAFVKSIYADFKTHFAGIELPEESQPKKRRPRRTKAAVKDTPSQTKSTPVEKPDTPPIPIPTEPVPETAEAPAIKSPRPPTVSVPYNFLEELKLGTAKGRPSLVDFMDSKLPITNEEHNIVFLYYLQQLVKVKPISIDHLYTCYRAAKIRAPLSIENTLDQRGWVKVAKNGNMTLSAAGKKYVEESMPKKLKG